MTLKCIIEITEVQTRPDNWASKDGWDGPGFYKVKDDNSCIYRVYEYGVDYISQPEHILNNPYKDPGEQISETLLLKLVAAASRAEVLK